jgi:hypothetical protein
MSAYAGGAAILAAILLGSQKSSSTGQAPGAPPVWARMRWIDYSWQMILPQPHMHPPPPPGQSVDPTQPLWGSWQVWQIGPDGYAVNVNGVAVSPNKKRAHRQERGTHEIENPIGQPGEYLYVWYPHVGQLQSINGYWVEHLYSPKHMPAPPPGAPKHGAWASRAGNKNYLVWLTGSKKEQADQNIKQFAWFQFHNTAQGWLGSPIIATSARGVNLPDENDSTGLWLFLLTPAQAAADAAVLQQAGNSQPPNSAPTAPVSQGNSPVASLDQIEAGAAAT